MNLSRDSPAVYEMGRDHGETMAEQLSTLQLLENLILA